MKIITNHEHLVVFLSLPSCLPGQHPQPCEKSNPVLLAINVRKLPPPAASLEFVRTGCQWRMLPGEFPNWNIVYGIYRHWIRSGALEQIHRGLREQLRRASGRKSRPTVAIIDSQTVRTAPTSLPPLLHLTFYSPRYHAD